MPQQFSARQFFVRLWHLPASAHWMDPLPMAHRRAIFFATAVMMLAFLWPPAAPEKKAITHPMTQQQEKPLSQRSPADTVFDPQGEWHRYRVATGQTLAQLFRDNALPMSDMLAMVKVEGSHKPLSNLQADQEVNIRINAQGTITGLSIESADLTYLFTRQSDGTFTRAL